MNTARDRAEGNDVIVVGAINVDFVVAAGRLPGPGETVVGSRVGRHGGGKGANAALAAALAGADVRLISAVGTDEMAALALRDLAEAGVDLTGVVELAGESTGVALIVVDPDGENQIAVAQGANAALDPAWVSERMVGNLPSAGCVLVSTEIQPDAVVAAVRDATRAGVTCILNTAPPIPVVRDLLECSPLLTPNAREAAALHAMLAPRRADASVTDDALALVARTGAPVVVTLGGDGALLATPDGAVQYLAAPAAEVLDTTGAGDTFNGVLAAQLATGADLLDSVRLALVAATLSVSHPGARSGMPSRDRIEAALLAPIGEAAR